MTFSFSYGIGVAACLLLVGAFAAVLAVRVDSGEDDCIYWGFQLIFFVSLFVIGIIASIWRAEEPMMISAIILLFIVFLFWSFMTIAMICDKEDLWLIIPWAAVAIISLSGAIGWLTEVLKPGPGPTAAPIPTWNPTSDPTWKPTLHLTPDPTWNPTPDPTGKPTLHPTLDPTWKPTLHPTPDPTWKPTLQPTWETKPCADSVEEEQCGWGSYTQCVWNQVDAICVAKVTGLFETFISPYVIFLLPFLMFLFLGFKQCLNKVLYGGGPHEAPAVGFNDKWAMKLGCLNWYYAMMELIDFMDLGSDCQFLYNVKDDNRYSWFSFTIVYVCLGILVIKYFLILEMYDRLLHPSHPRRKQLSTLQLLVISFLGPLIVAGSVACAAALFALGILTREGNRVEKHKVVALVQTMPLLNIAYILKKKNKMDAYHHAHAKWCTLVRIFEDVPAISLALLYAYERGITQFGIFQFSTSALGILFYFMIRVVSGIRERCDECCEWLDNLENDEGTEIELQQSADLNDEGTGI